MQGNTLDVLYPHGRLRHRYRNYKLPWQAYQVQKLSYREQPDRAVPALYLSWKALVLQKADRSDRQKYLLLHK